MSITHHRHPGESDRLIDAEQEFGPGAVLVTDGNPDFVRTPAGFQHGSVGPYSRCEVRQVWLNAPRACPMCNLAPVHKLFVVEHEPTGSIYLVFECVECRQFTWAVNR